MIDLTEFSNDYDFTDKSQNHQNLDIMDFHTVDFDSKHLQTKRSQSLKDCKYEQILAPKLCKCSSVEPLIPDKENKQHLSNSEN